MTPLLDELVGAAVDVVRRPLPSTVRDHAALLIADTLGVTLAGGRRPESAALVDGDDLTGSWRVVPGPTGGRRESPQPGAGAGPFARFLTAGYGWGAPDRVAYVNATVTCALELDEGTRPTGHPAAHVLPAALAAAEAVDATWPELIAAFVAGYEVAAGLFDGLRLRPPTHPHGHLGAAGAATAVALLTAEDPLAMARAAATIPLLTTWAPCLEGANVRNTWAGHAASAGLLARRLVRAGFRGSPASYDASFDGLVADRVEVDPALVGTRITGGYIKLYSACAITHSAIEAARKLYPLTADPTSGTSATAAAADGPSASRSAGTAPEGGPGVPDVAEVRVAVNGNGMKTAAQPGDTDLSRRFSTPYAVAVALLRGDAAPGRFDVADPEALELARRVTVVEDVDATAAWPRLAPATVTVVAADGSVRTAHADDAHGHPGDPAPASAVRAKFRALTAHPDEIWDLLTSPQTRLPVRAVLDALLA